MRAARRRAGLPAEPAAAVQRRAAALADRTVGQGQPGLGLPARLQEVPQRLVISQTLSKFSVRLQEVPQGLVRSQTLYFFTLRGNFEIKKRCKAREHFSSFTFTGRCLFTTTYQFIRVVCRRVACTVYQWQNIKGQRRLRVV